MTDRLFAGKTGLVLLLAALAAACSSAGGQRPIVSAPGPATSQADIEAIVTLLDNGERNKAKRRLSALLKRDTLNPSLLVLHDSITRAPDELLGPTSFAYTTRSGETMAQLAQRFLGNRLKSYQLARYNGIEKPVSLEAGRVLRIPRQPAQAAPAPPPRTAVKPAAPPRAQTALARPKPAVKPAAPAANPAAAGKARSAGLAALNQGKPEHAVALLSRAATLDPANPAIARDLARAKRIAATVRAQN